MTLYAAYIGGDVGSARAVDQWAGENFDGFLAYTEGWDGWDGLRATRVTEVAGRLGDTNRRMLWSIMAIPDVPHENIDQGVGYFREGASGARNGLYEQIGRDLVAYHDRIGDTGPIYVRSVWEIPGEWFGWNKAAVADVDAYKGTWRNFATSLRKASPRIKIVWDFNSDRGKVEHLYPGDDVVDVISQDIYWIHDLQGVDPKQAFHKSRHGYSRGLQWHLEWCREKKKPMAIAEWGIKLNDIDIPRLDCTTWVKELFAFIDECNAPGNPGMAFVTWWNSNDANTGHFVGRVGEPHLSAVRDLFRARLPGSVLGGGGQPPVGPPVPPPVPPPVSPPADWQAEAKRLAAEVETLATRIASLESGKDTLDTRVEKLSTNVSNAAGWLNAPTKPT